jgi:cellulose synthase/poly-beta-1,6-N-acetylglucosamine synthase-like glycosyltransferase
VKPSTDIDAFVFIDADTLVDGGLLEAADLHLQRGESILQASYRVLHPERHPLVGLRALAFCLYHDVRGRGKSRLGLSCGLWGNGMVLSRAAIAQIPWQSFTAVEDAEQHIQVLLHGSKVFFLEEASVYGHMPLNWVAAKAQQSRWEAGRLSLVRHYWKLLLSAAVRHRRPAPGLALLDLALPPLSFHLVFAGSAAILAALVAGPYEMAFASACLVALGSYVAIGLLSARLPVATYAALLYVPIYVSWKAWLFVSEVARWRDPDWVRTARE